ncbi:MAG: ABC transporter ATP-binding protein [Clostridiales bacterium]|nr:ABC transporter ATP-binding protein [Clostridiales bacterium]
MSENCIKLNNINKYFGNKQVLDNVCFEVPFASVYGLLGPSGCGKTTTVKIISGILEATSGETLVLGEKMPSLPLMARIGYMAQSDALYPDLSAKENMEFFGALYGLAGKAFAKRFDDVMALVNLSDDKDKVVGAYSGGMKRRLSLAMAILHQPTVLILDEPTVGLDPRQIIEIRHLIKDLGAEHTVVLSSHILHEVADVCERVVIINNGAIVAQDTLENLTKSISDSFRVRLRVLGPEREAKRVIREVAGVESIEALGSKEPGSADFMVEAAREADIRVPLFRALSRADLPILTMRPLDIELEDIFLQLTADAGEGY